MKSLRSFILIIIFFINDSVSLAQEITHMTLTDAVEYALKNNQEVIKSINNIARAKEQKWQATTIGLPQISGNVSYNNNLINPPSPLPALILPEDIRQQNNLGPDDFINVVFSPQHTMRGSLRLDQVIFDGSYLVGLQSAKTFLKISELANEQTEIGIREAVIRSYTNALLAKENLEISIKNLESVKKDLEDLKKTQEVGLAAIEDVEQLEINFTNLKIGKDRAERENYIANKSLNIVLGLPLKDSIAQIDKLKKIVFDYKNTLFGQQNIEVNQNTEYKIAETDVKSKELLLKYEKSKALPSLSGFLDYNQTAFNDRFTYFSESQDWIEGALLGVNLNVPIFSSFNRRSKTQEAKINLSESKLNLERKKEELKLKHLTAKTNFDFASNQLDMRIKALDLAEKLEKKEKIKFKEGLSTSLNVNTVQRQLYQEQQNYLQAMILLVNEGVGLESLFK